MSGSVLSISKVNLSLVNTLQCAKFGPKRTLSSKFIARRDRNG